MNVHRNARLERDEHICDVACASGVSVRTVYKWNKRHRITGDRHGQSKARGIGWEFVHVCVDDHSRIVFSQVLKSERKECAAAFLKAVVQG